MKKISIFLTVTGVSLLLSGCGTNNMLTCTDEVNANGMTTKTTYNIEYKGNDVKHLKITYHYTQDNEVDGIGTGTDGSSADGTDRNNRVTEEDNVTEDGTNNRNNTDMDGTINSNESDDSDDFVDGAVGDAVDTVTDTILDLSGIRERYTNQLNTYRNIQGFTSDVEVDNDDEYKIAYDIDYDTISDSDLSLFNASRDLDTLRDNYESQGLTCK